MPNNVSEFPDVEQLLIDHLDAGAPISTKVPKPRPDTFVRVERTGGPRTSRFMDSPTVVVEAWAVRESEAIALASLLRGLMADLSGTSPDGFAVKQVGELSGITNLPDPASGGAHHRYTQTFTLHVRGH